MKRVMVVGGPGSGKSTFARRLGDLTGLPVFHIDHIHWLSGWVERPRAEKIAMAGRVEAGEEWIFEGGLSATYANRAARADTIVWLDVGLPLRLWRVFVRVLRYRGETRPDLPQGCNEQFGPELVELMRYMIRFAKRNDARIATLGVENPDKFVHLTGRRAANRWLWERVQHG